MSGWYVLVEENMGATARSVWQISRKQQVEDHETALAYGAEVAATHTPKHPLSNRGRSVFRVSEHEWLVLLQGASAAFPFRVVVAEHESDHVS
jgi:hypothetical protein